MDKQRGEKGFAVLLGYNAGQLSLLRDDSLGSPLPSRFHLRIQIGLFARQPETIPSFRSLMG